MDPKRRQQAKHHLGVFDRQLRQLIMLVQCSVWRRIEPPTDPDEETTSHKLLERLALHTDAGKLMRANRTLCMEKFECRL